MPDSPSSEENEPSHDRQADIRRVAKNLRDGGYSYDQSAHLFKESRRQVGLSPPDRSGEGSPERLTSEELEAFLEAAYDHSGRRGLMMRTLFETGTRVGTFVQIDTEDVAFRDREIRVVGKGDKPRDVPILSSLANELRLHLGERRTGPLFRSRPRRLIPLSLDVISENAVFHSQRSVQSPMEDNHLPHDSLLVSLSSYRPRPGRRPIEDFITEAFAWLLRTQEGLGEAFVHHVESSASDSIQFSDVEGVEWSTQASFPNSRPDMVARFNETTLAFEHKVHSEASSDQLRRHHEGVEQNGHVILITSAEWHFADPADVKMTWRQVYRWLDGASSHIEEPAMIREFQSLLESRGLGPRSQIPEPSLRAYSSVKKIEKQLWTLFKTLMPDEEPAWDFVFDEVPHLKRGETRMKGSKGNLPVEGRIGIRFQPWRPGVFAGVLLDGNDHKVEMSNPRLGPDLVVVLDVGSKGTETMPRQQFLNSHTYSQLVERLQNETEHRGWEVVDTHGRAEKGNRWHPLILRRSLAPLLREESTFDAQRTAILEALKGGVKFLLKDSLVRQAGAPKRKNESS